MAVSKQLFKNKRLSKYEYAVKIRWSLSYWNSTHLRNDL